MPKRVDLDGAVSRVRIVTIEKDDIKKREGRGKNTKGSFR